jgi:hypothetical protein
VIGQGTLASNAVDVVKNENTKSIERVEMNTSFERTDQKDEWITPPHVFEPLQPFDLDVCQPIVPPFQIAPKGFNINDDGLSQPWHGFVWCNPPYGTQTAIWLKKMAEHNNGIALIFARTDTRMFHDYVFKADAILFIKGRLSFLDVKGVKSGTAGAPSCLVAYGAEAVERLRNSNIQGKLVILNT